MSFHLDACAAMNLLVEELDCGLATTRRRSERSPSSSSWLLHTECTAPRIVLRTLSTRIPSASCWMSFRSLISRAGSVLFAGILPGGNDALQLAAAPWIGLDEIVSCDVELAAAASSVGIAARQLS